MSYLYKVLQVSEDGKKASACNGGSYDYDMPSGDDPGAWSSSIEHLYIGSQGYHVCTADQIPGWNGNAVFEAEGNLGPYESGHLGKMRAYHSIRLLRQCPGWNNTARRLFEVEALMDLIRQIDYHCYDAIKLLQKYASEIPLDFKDIYKMRTLAIIDNIELLVNLADAMYGRIDWWQLIKMMDSEWRRLRLHEIIYHGYKDSKKYALQGIACPECVKLRDLFI